MIWLGIDQGSIKSGYCIVEFPDYKIHSAGVIENEELLNKIYILCGNKVLDKMAIERFATMGRIGQTTIDAIEWGGRFIEAYCGTPVSVPRRQVKKTLCGTGKIIKDAQIRERLIEIFGEPGTTKARGGTYGVASHAWSALAIATAAYLTSTQPDT